jgi:3-hydroxyisobutyrate dehydrogenase-like beta-hydroxyacid dehydrogenase
MTAVVGFVGLGNIGKPMALRVAADPGTELWAYDIAPEPVAELVAAGAKAAQSVGELAVAADVVSVMVRDDAQVADVLDQILAAASQRRSAAPLTVMVHSTVAPATPAELAAKAALHGVWLVDAPVSGGAMGAAAGTLAVLVGGTEEAYASVEPVLRLMGTKVVHAGPIGAGTQFKLARNLVTFVGYTAATEAQRLAEAAGLDLVALGEVVRHTDAITGGPGAIMYRATTAPIPVGDFWETAFGHARDLGEKDLKYAIELAGRLGVDVPLAEIALERLGVGLGLQDRQ